MLYSCAVYISSGLSTVAARAAAAAAASSTAVAVVDTFTDVAYARSSVKLVAEPAPLLVAAEAAAAAALEHVDLSQEPHPAPHPRQGAVDMISFMPLSELRTDAICPELEACDELAWRLGERLGGAHGCPVLMYGPRAGRTLVETRRGTSFFASTKATNPREASTRLPLDFGPGSASRAGDASEAAAAAASSHADLPQRCGVAILGTQPYVTNFNICIAGAGLEACKSAEGEVRRAFGVQVMALPHAGDTVEIGCNLQARDGVDSPARDAVLELVAAHVQPAGGRVERSYVIGLTPGEARARGEEALGAGPPSSGPPSG